MKKRIILPTMKKRIVNISQANIFDEILEKLEVSKILEEIADKWKNKDFSKQVYFDKKITKKRNNMGHRSGIIQFIKAYRPKQ